MKYAMGQDAVYNDDMHHFPVLFNQFTKPNSDKVLDRRTGRRKPPTVDLSTEAKIEAMLDMEQEGLKVLI